MSAAKPMQQAAILQYAKQLHLPTLGGQFISLAEEAAKQKQSHLSYLEALLEAEIEERDHKAVARRIQEDAVHIFPSEDSATPFQRALETGHQAESGHDAGRGHVESRLAQ